MKSSNKTSYRGILMFLQGRGTQLKATPSTAFRKEKPNVDVIIDIKSSFHMLIGYDCFYDKVGHHDGRGVRGSFC